MSSIIENQIDPISYIKAELDNGNKHIVVRPGVYKVVPPDCVYFRLANLNDTTIDFTGVEIIGMTRTRMFDISGCVNLTLKGLTFDYDPLAFTQAQITQIDQEKNWDVKVIQGYPVEDIIDTGGCWPIQVYDQESLELVNPMRFRDNISVTRTGVDTYSITGGINRDGKLGDIVVFSLQNFSENGNNIERCKTIAVESCDCKNLRIENFTIYSTPGGVAFKEIGNTKSVYSNCIIDRRPPEIDIAKRDVKRLRSGNHDAFIVKNAPIGPQIIGCTARYHCDDCVNISGVYSIVSSSSAGELRILDGHPILSGRSEINISVGDSVQIMTRDGERLDDARVLALTPCGQRTDEEKTFLDQLELWPTLSEGFKNVYTIKLDSKSNISRGAIIMSNNCCGSGFKIKDCTFGHTRARGLLLKASDGMIEDNTIEDCFGSGIQVATEYEWMSGGWGNNLKIIGNRIANNRGAGISIGSKPYHENLHRHIAIKNNHITTMNSGINAIGCTALDVSGNTVEVLSEENWRAIILENIIDGTEKNNSVTCVKKV